jgi:molecular chaperone GrpE
LKNRAAPLNATWDQVPAAADKSNQTVKELLMNKKNPYGMEAGFDPEDIFRPAQNVGPAAPMDFDRPDEVFTSAAAGRGPDGWMPEDNRRDAGQEAGTEPAAREDAVTGIGFEELAALAKARLCPNCPVAVEAEDTRLRALAETDNIRKRMLKEHEESAKFAAASVLADILPALDNLDLALEHAKGQAACKDFFVGVDMTRKLMLDALKNHGLVVLGSEGEPFDPSIHEAVATNQDPGVADGAVSAILNKGYKLHERLLRPARVIVCKK